MRPLNNFFVLFQWVFVLNYFLYHNSAFGRITPPQAAGKPGMEDGNDTGRIPIGMVLDQNSYQIQQAFKVPLFQYAGNNTSDYMNFQVFVDVINTADSFKLSRIVCNQFSRGVVSILASVQSDSFDTFHSYANTFHMPFVTPFFPEKVLPPSSGLPDHAMSILPDYHKAVLGTVMYYGWKNVIYLYDSHDGSAVCGIGNNAFISVKSRPEATDFLATLAGGSIHLAQYKKRRNHVARGITSNELQRRNSAWPDVRIPCSLAGMLRLQQIFKSLVPGQSPFFRIANVKRISTAKEIIFYLRLLEKTDRWSNKYVILDCSTAIAKETIITHVRDVQLGRRNYHYLFSGLVLDDRWDKEVREYGTINMTGFRMVDTSRKFVKDLFHMWKVDSIAAKGALLYDAARTLLEAFQRILRYKPYIIENLMNKTNKRYRFLNCDTQEAVPLKYGTEIAEFIKKTQVEGFSGKIRFSSSGVRTNFSLIVVQNTPDGDMTKIATWYDDKGFRALRRMNGFDVSGKYDRNKTYTVVSIQEPPYFTSTGSKKYSENDVDIVYGGFCADLAELIAEKLQITIQFRLAADGKYGNMNPGMIGGWDGMVGELVRKEVDMVIAPLIVTAEREAVIDFSKPFLSFNRVGSKTGRKEKVQMFGFLKPLAKETWYLLATSILLVGVVMFIVTRFSPMEWRVVAVTDPVQSLEEGVAPATRATVINHFSFLNSIWYSLSSIMQQGSEVFPRSISGRIVSAAWWFFALIVVCSYTAFLASQLTITGLESPVLPVYNRMAHCPEDMQAEDKKEITVDDELHGNADVLVETYITEPNDYVSSTSNCEMIVSVVDPGIMDFSIAFPRGSKLRTGVNLALIAIRKEGEMNRLIRKYFHNLDCGMPTVNIGGSELTLGEIVGLFYLLISALAVGLFIALIEFCNYHRSEAAKANISIKTALRAKTRVQVNETQETCKRNTNRRRRRREQERGWNGTGTTPGSYAGFPPFEQPMNQSPMNPMRPVDLHSPLQSTRVMTRKRSRQVVQQVHESCEALELETPPYFTPANQIGQEETALHNSLTQV